MTYPLPPIELRRIIGPIDDDSFINHSGDFIYKFRDLEYDERYIFNRVFDFGCGCGRNAKRLLEQFHVPSHYVGIDINPVLINWAKYNLKAPNFSFYHNPVEPKRSKAAIKKFGTGFTVCLAHSVFTHLYEDQAKFYLEEMRDMLAPDGLIFSTWFLFYRPDFPVLADYQHCVYVNEIDPIQAIYYDRAFLQKMFVEIGYKIVSYTPTFIRGFQNEIILARRESEYAEINI